MGPTEIRAMEHPSTASSEPAGTDAVASLSIARSGVLEIPGALGLHHGGALASVHVAYRIAGPARAPVVAALGGISAGRHVIGFDTAGRGWWSELVGPGRALDSERYRVLGIDYLGGSGETTGPRAGASFPSVSSYDQARILLRCTQSPRYRVPARDHRSVLWRHGRARIRGAIPRTCQPAPRH